MPQHLGEGIRSVVGPGHHQQRRLLMEEQADGGHDLGGIIHHQHTDRLARGAGRIGQRHGVIIAPAGPDGKSPDTVILTGKTT